MLCSRPMLAVRYAVRLLRRARVPEICGAGVESRAWRIATLPKFVLGFGGLSTAACVANTQVPRVMPAEGGTSAQQVPPAASATAPPSAAPVTTQVDKHALPPPPDSALWADVPRASPEAVSLARPGGDGDSAHASALVRLLEEPFGLLRDKDDQVRIQLPDVSHWKRVRYRSFDHLVGFRYGEKYHAVTVLLTLDTRAGRQADSLACIRQAETMARPRARAMSVELSKIEETEMVWQGKRVVIHSVDGVFPWALKRIGFTAAWAAYPAYEKSCLIYGIGIKHEDKPQLARLFRDRFILESVPRVETRTQSKPERKP